MKVCLLNDSFPPVIDGVANAVVNYGNIINSSGNKAAVVTPFYPDADDTVFPFDVVRYPSIDTTKLVGYRAGIPFDAKVMGELQSRSFDIIHTHCPITSTMISRILRDAADVPVVFTYHTKFDIDIQNAIHGKLLQDTAKQLLVENIESCDEVWTVSKGAGENLVSLGYSGDYIVMPNGVDFKKGRVADSMILAETSQYDLPDGIPVFMFVGRMMWYKGIKISLDALKILTENGIDYRMVFIGGGGNKEEIVAYTNSLGLSDKVIFVDPIHNREKIRAWYCRANLFLFPSTFDTNGLVVREAAACSLASVLVKDSCASEGVTDGVDGFLIDENPESMAETLMKIANNFEKMAQVGINAQNNLYMSWDESVHNAIERYAVVIENYKSGYYKKHDKLTDDFFKSTADAMELLITMEKQHREIEAELANIKEEIAENRMTMVTDLKTDLNNRIKKLENYLEKINYLNRFK